MQANLLFSKDACIEFSGLYTREAKVKMTGFSVASIIASYIAPPVLDAVYLSKYCRYEKKLKVEYKVQCGGDDDLAYCEFIDLDLQSKDCDDDGYLR